MFDCGMHMGYLDHRRYPDFSRISASRDYNTVLSCVIITHLYDVFLFVIVIDKSLLHYITLLCFYLSFLC